MKYCHDCLTPINRYSKEEYCAICKKDRALKESSTAFDFLSKLLWPLFGSFCESYR